MNFNLVKEIEMYNHQPTSKKLTVKDIIVDNERDRQTLDYLISIRGEAGIQHILDKFFNGGTRPYVSNIVKYGKIEIPDDAFRTNVVSKEEMQERVAELKAMLKGGKNK